MTHQLLWTYGVVWCDRVHAGSDSTQLDKTGKCSESQKLIKTGRVQLNRIATVIKPDDQTRLNRLVESDRPM
jgi:hypothetical protein